MLDKAVLLFLRSVLVRRADLDNCYLGLDKFDSKKTDSKRVQKWRRSLLVEILAAFGIPDQTMYRQYNACSEAVEGMLRFIR